MAEQRHGTEFGEAENGLDLRPLLRLGAWGSCAFAALVAATLAGQSDIGAQRTLTAIAAIRGQSLSEPSATAETASAPTDAEAQRLAEAVRNLTADRDQLAVRLAALEHSLGDLTSSISRPPTPPASPATVGRPSEPAVAAEPAADGPPALPASQPLPRPGRMALIQSYVTATPDTSSEVVSRSREATVENSPRSTATRAEFALDVGGAASINGLHALWEQLRARPELRSEGLRPLVMVRAGSRPGSKELRLVLGPLANAAAATRLCAGLASAGLPCRPTIYSGQQLASARPDRVSPRPVR